MLSPSLLCSSEPAFLPQHYHVVDVPIAFAGTETMESDLIIFVRIRHKIVFGASVEWAWGVVTILFNFRETNTKQHFGIVD